MFEPEGTDYWQRGVDFWNLLKPGLADTLEEGSKRSNGVFKFGFDFSVGFPSVIVINLPAEPNRFLGMLDSENCINLFPGGGAGVLANNMPAKLDKVFKDTEEFKTWLFARIDAAMAPRSGATPEPKEAQRKAPRRKPGGITHR
jgi:hypothetical protein